LDAIELFGLSAFPAIYRDPDDDKVIATAIQGRADYLLTADEDILASPIVQLLQQAGIRVGSIDEFIIALDY
jgi:predicted nucleic acid-binding protein